MIDIYYVEEDETISQAVKEFLARDGYRVWVFSTLAGIRQALWNMLPALVLVDWNMPDGNGKLLCQWIHQTWRELPVIFITVRSEAREDYIVKPFTLDVLLERIRAMLGKAGNIPRQRWLSCDAVAVDQDSMKAFCDEQEVSLSPAEYQLLLYLLQNKGKTVTRKKLLERVWDVNGNGVNDNTLTVTMKRLRGKLHQPAGLKTVRSVGYRLEETE